MTRATAKSASAEPDEPDRLDGFSSPREVNDLIGHETALAQLEAAWAGGRMHHAWLLLGPEGIGKATLAYRVARSILGQASGHASAASADVVFGKVAGLSHPNLLLLRRSWNDKTKKYGQWIGVEEVRRLRGFLGHSAAEGAWRVVIVDRAEELNPNAANALLKSLEEPPARTVFLLVAGSEGRLPVTIRSRCQVLRFEPLPPEALERAVRAALDRDEHEVAPDVLATALALAEGSVRRVLTLATGDGALLYTEILHLLHDLPRLDGARLHTLAERVAAGNDSDRIELFFSLLLGVIERLVRQVASGEGGIGEERKLAAQLIAPDALGAWAELWEEIGRAKTEALILNLDRTMLTLDTFFRLQLAAETHSVAA